MLQRIRCLTAEYNNIVNVVKTPAGVCPAFDPSVQSPPKDLRQFIAIWDTGATNSVITARIITEVEDA